MEIIHIPAQLSDKELLAEVKRLADNERVATAGLIATLAELDARRLYLGEGLFLSLLLLHARSPSVRARGLRTDRGCPRRAPGIR